MTRFGVFRICRSTPAKVCLTNSRSRFPSENFDRVRISVKSFPSSGSFRTNTRALTMVFTHHSSAVSPFVIAVTS